MIYSAPFPRLHTIPAVRVSSIIKTPGLDLWRGSTGSLLGNDLRFNRVYEDAHPSQYICNLRVCHSENAQFSQLTQVIRKFVYHNRRRWDSSQLGGQSSFRYHIPIRGRRTHGYTGAWSYYNNAYYGVHHGLYVHNLWVIVPRHAHSAI